MLFLFVKNHLNFGANFAPTILVINEATTQTFESFNNLTTMKSFVDKNMTRENTTAVEPRLSGRDLRR